MKKQLITLATATAMTAPAAVLADAHSDGPEVYGRVHLSLDHEGYDVNAAGDSGDLTLASRTSRIGVRGSEEVSYGLTAIYQFEHQLDASDSGFSGQQLRDTFVGVQGDWGQVRAGRLPALNGIVYGPGNFFPTQAGDPGNVLLAMGAAEDDGSFLGGRASGVVEYTTALAGPVQASVQFIPSAYEEPGDHEHDYSLWVTYDEGPLAAQGTVYVYHYDDDPVGSGAEAGDNDTLAALQAEYDFGLFRVGGGFATVSSDVDDMDDSAAWLGAGFDVTETGTINVQYSGLMADRDDADASIIALGFTEALSDRTSAYANVAFIDNDEKNAVNPHSYASTGPQDGIANDEDGQVVSVGVIHDF
ncbi:MULTISPECIES: porin [Halorhodospira]|uniref:porin n=1 Tax=Halorhodospira TaxID=85108 RepID=UPI001EE7A3B2|nr:MULTISPECIES: porin [Halorhodospira]MCG5527516.1 porin [Halorhodospira halophila]MCG5544342.1 porin [Halorhodospira sp. 9628]